MPDFRPEDYKEAISYLRFSHPDQARGHSEDRQTDAAAEVCARFGWRLIDHYQDLGVSGGRGKHRRKGALGRLIQRLRSGEIKPGKVIIVEALDRLSREEVMIAQEQFLSIVNLGFAIYTTIDGSGFDTPSMQGNGVARLFVTLGQMIGANSVFRNMSDRGRKSWTVRRGKVDGLCPAWLEARPDHPEKYVVREGCGEIIREVVQMARSIGCKPIAAKLNERGIPRFSDKKRKIDGWTSSAVYQLLTNRALLGETEYHMAPDGVSRIAIGQIEKKYPAIIDAREFAEIQAILHARQKFRGRKGRNHVNLFTGLARCSCGSAMYLHVNKNHKYVYLQCVGARVLKTCDRVKYVPYRPFEAAMLHPSTLKRLALRDEAGSIQPKVNDELATARTRVRDLEIKIANLEDAIEAGGLSGLKKKYEQRVAEVNAAQAEVRRLEMLEIAEPDQSEVMKRIEALSQAALAGDYNARVRIASEFRLVISKIVFEDGVWRLFPRVSMPISWPLNQGDPGIIPI